VLSRSLTYSQVDQEVDQDHSDQFSQESGINYTDLFISIDVMIKACDDQSLMGKHVETGKMMGSQREFTARLTLKAVNGPHS
jgi:hypothetical protein